MRLDTLKMLAHECAPIAHVTQSFVEISDGLEFRLAYLKDKKQYHVVMVVLDGRDDEQNVRWEIRECFELMRDAIAEGLPCA